MCRTLRGSALALALAGIAIAGAACVPNGTLPSDCDATAVERSAKLTAGGLEPDAIDVCKGQRVTITIDVQRAGELHLHGYDDQVPAQEVTAGTQKTIAFTASRPGQFVLEMHTGGDHVQLGILTVHER